MNELARELEELAGRLRSGELSAEDAAAAVERCAELAARLGSELDSAARDAEHQGQERLL
jgi:hypothetical protein